MMTLSSIHKIFILLSLAFIGILVHAEYKTIPAPPERRLAQTSSQERLASSTFLNFLNCGKADRPSIDDSEISKCTSQFFSQTVGPARLTRYNEMLMFPERYSPLFQCDPELSKLIKIYESSGYDFFLCFLSNAMEPMRPGVVFFKTERGIPKIYRLKL